MEAGVILELSQVQPAAPLSWASMSIAAKKCPETLVNMLGMAIRPWMVSRGHPELNLGQFEKLLRQIVGKSSFSIRENGHRHAMKLVHMQQEELGP